MKLTTTRPSLPKNVRKYIAEMYDFLDREHGEDLSFFTEAEMTDPAIRLIVLEEEMGPICIKNWIQTGEAGLTKTQASTVLERIPILYTLHTLKEKGFMDSIEDNEGCEVYFLSDKGKEFGKMMGWDKKQKM